MSQTVPSQAAVLGQQVPPTVGPRGTDVLAQAVDFEELNAHPGGPVLNSLDHLLDVTVTVTAELGRVTRSIGDVLNLKAGAVVELDSAVAEPIDLLVQGVRVARGEVVVVNDRFAIRITEIADPKKR
jgi:flagellar motor switch protein FliN